ncbi:MAG: extensin family protein, partial [Aestuariivirgaceae bacterium]
MPEIALDVPKPPAPEVTASVGPASYGDDCRDELALLGADFSIAADIKGTGVCHVTNPVQLRSVATPAGRLELPGAPLLNCAFAQQFVVWLSDVAAPLVAGFGEARLSSISTGTSYQCRARNGDLAGKMSEHAFGNAVDITGIALTNSRRIETTAASDP